MTYTANDLISSSYYASGVVSREFETVSGGQASDGLQWLNDILSEKTIDLSLIPYETTYSFNSVRGQEVYYIPNLSQISTITFFKDTVRYALTFEKRNQYFGSSRVGSINSLPFEWYFERQTGGGKLYIYFSPDQVYPIEIHGIFRLQNVTKGQDLSLNTTVANLGVSTVAVPGELTGGQLVINTVDVAGSYSTIGALVNYINSGVVPNVTASINVNDFILSSTTDMPVNITVTTSGTNPTTTDKGTMVAASLADMGAVYSNGTLGQGATLTGAMTPLIIDGVTIGIDERVLIKNQTLAIENGIYRMAILGVAATTSWVLIRATNFDTSDDVIPGSLVLVSGGTQALTYWVQNNTIITVGTTAIVFTQFSNVSFSNFSTKGTSLEKIYMPRGLDQFYITYLKYALSDRICAEYNFDTPQNVKRQLSKYESFISQKSRVMDLRMEKASTLQRGSALNYGQINIGRGYTTNS